MPRKLEKKIETAKLGLFLYEVPQGIKLDK